MLKAPTPRNQKVAGGWVATMGRRLILLVVFLGGFVVGAGTPAVLFFLADLLVLCLRGMVLML